MFVALVEERAGDGALVALVPFFGPTAAAADELAERYARGGLAPVLEDRAPSTLGDLVTSDTQAQISAALTSAGLPPESIQSAVQSYTGLTTDAQNSILNIVEGGKVTATSLAPLIALGLSATGVGAPIVAAVAAALPIIDGIIGMLAPKPPQCDWYIGADCVSNAVRPYGPGDPTWTTFDQWTGAIDVGQNTPPGPGGAYGQALRDTTVDAAWPLYRQTIGCELALMGESPSDPATQFYRAYYLAWQKNKEFQINGFTAADDYSLLTAVANAWNGVHLSSSTLTIEARMPPNQLTNAPFCLFTAAGVRYVNILLAGGVDGDRHPPVTINLTPQIVKLAPLTLRGVGATNAAAAAPATSSSSSTAGNVARVGVGLALVGGGLWAALGNPAATFAAARRAVGL